MSNPSETSGSPRRSSSDRLRSTGNRLRAVPGRLRSASDRLLAIVAATLLLCAVAPGSASAQEQTFHACYVPEVGAMYLIQLTGLPTECLSTGHEEISWTEGGGATATDHGELTGLTDDDHPQYLLAGGGRALTGDLSADGNTVTGLPAATGAGEAVPFEQAVKNGDAAAGDLGGTFPDPSVAGLQGNSVSSTAPSDGQVLTWNDGVTAWEPQTAPSGVTDHGALGGLADDDHAQYLLANGVRDATDGFAVTGTLNTGRIPILGAGTRMMWYPGKAAFRAGHVNGTEWDDTNVGSFSTAIGLGTTAIGSYSTAMGYRTTASGSASTAMGWLTTASGSLSTAMGSFASTNGQGGSFVYGDRSTTNVITAHTPNQFMVRAAGGTIFYSNSELTGGVRLAAGGSSWSMVSDAAMKENWRELDGEGVLADLAAMPIREWNYIAQADGIRHVGPTAQDFHAAFGLGEDPLRINTVDADGIALLAIQALESRTTELRKELRAEREAHRGLAEENEELRVRLDSMEERLDRLEANGNR